MAIERTFSIIKPDATERNLTGAINAVIEKAGLRIVAQKRIRMTREQAETFYAVHKARPFFGELVEFMTPVRSSCRCCEGEGAMPSIATSMGATDPSKAADGTIRKLTRSRSAKTRCTAPTRRRRARSRSRSSSRQRNRRLIEQRQAIAAADGDEAGGTAVELAVADLRSRDIGASSPSSDRDAAADLLGRARQDHVDQHPAVGRQRARHRDGVPRTGAAPAILGHGPRRRCAVLLRIIFTFIVVQLMALPYLKLVGGLALLWIAAKLLVPEHEDEEGGCDAAAHLWAAVRIVAIADIVMSLDNVIAVAAAANGSIPLLVLGLAISVPLIVAVRR
jgi:nucleoside-diphosphate kinase